MSGREILSDRTLVIIGAAASLGTMAVVFVGHPVVSLLSLLVLETVLIGVWFYYVRKKHNLLYPYPYEVSVVSYRYVFESRVKMTFEAVKVVKVTQANLAKLPLTYTWTGSRGNIVVKSEFFPGKKIREIDVDHESESGEIQVKYPVPPGCKVGENVVVHLRMGLEDSANQNEPKLSYSNTHPTRLCIMEVILDYKDKNPPAVLERRLRSSSSLRQYQKEEDVEFHKKTRSYHVMVVDPRRECEYRLVWNP